jgi:hypothetical protein
VTRLDDKDGPLDVLLIIAIILIAPAGAAMLS